MKPFIQRLNKTAVITLLLSVSALSVADHVAHTDATNLQINNTQLNTHQTHLPELVAMKIDATTNNSASTPMDDVNHQHSVLSNDGKISILSRLNKANGTNDLYISRMFNNGWTEPQKLGAKVNTAAHEINPMLGPEEKKLIFTRVENGVSSQFRIDLSALMVNVEITEHGQLLYRQQAIEAISNGYTMAGISLNNEWKKAIYELAANTMQHPAWGMNHSERNYLLTLHLAKEEKVKIDEEVLFAASFLHDMATFHPWNDGSDHSLRAAELVPPILQDLGFPSEKIESVQDLILGHMFYSPTKDYPLARLFHDADTLDFMGVIGITRILSINTRETWASNTQIATKTLTNFTQQLPDALLSDTAKIQGEYKLHNMQHFLNQLEKDSHGFKAP